MSIFPKLQAKRKPRLTYASKDYVEHLRTVHFALLSVSVGLLLLIFSAKPYNTRKAALQLEAILRLKELWTPEGLKPHAHSQYHSFMENGLEVVKERLTSVRLPIAEAHNEAFVRVSGTTGRSALLMIRPVKATEFLWRREHAIIFPDNMGDLERWWDEFGKHSHTYVDADSVRLRRECLGLLGSGQVVYASEACRVSSERSANLNRNDKPLSSSLEFLGINQQSDPSESLESPFILKIVDGKSVMLLLSLAEFSEYTISRYDLLQSVLATRDGDFTASFPDLYRATIGESKSLDLASVLKHLQAESASSDVFEAFGLKIPAGQVTTWGALVTLCIQLYLYLYLRGLKKPLEASDEAWKVGWFAANDALLPRSMFVITVFALPVIAITLLLINALDQRMQQRALTWSWHFVTSRDFLGLIREFKAVPLLICGCCVSVGLGYLSWVNRPRIARIDTVLQPVI